MNSCLPQHNSLVSGLCVPPTSWSCVICTCLAANTCQPATHILWHKSQSAKMPAGPEMHTVGALSVGTSQVNVQNGKTFVCMQRAIFTQ